jgi:hypothetical protein
MIGSWLHLTGILLLAVGSQLSEAKSDGPRIALTKLDSEPSPPSYFENSDTVLFYDSQSKVVHLSFDGGLEWDVVKDEAGEMAGAVGGVQIHPFDNKKAYILGLYGIHWVTTDQGVTWNSFELPVSPTSIATPLRFHGQDSQKVIIHGAQCSPFRCIENAFYTLDDFNNIAPLRETPSGCLWAVGTPEFADSAPDVAHELSDRVFCIARGLKDPFSHAFRLVMSDDFFSRNEDGVEVKINNGRPVTGVVNIASEKKFIVAAAKSQGTDELAMFVTADTKTWHRAEFGTHKLEEDAYTVLESTNYSIQVDVLNTNARVNMGVLFTSNSNGTYFTKNIEHTNRDDRGFVDFEKNANIQGIVMVNVVDNWDEVEKQGTERHVVSKISFDDGRTFESLSVKDEELHLHSFTEPRNIGRVFSSPAPGIVMGVGNTGKYLKEYVKDGNLYVSDDAGLTWRQGLEKPHKYEFGNLGAVIMAIRDDGKPTKKVKYSINHGKEWHSAELEHEILPALLTTTPDSTSLKFLLFGYKDQSSWYSYTIDFDGLHERECKESDYEKWPARLNEKNEPDCLMGHKQFYHRRKSDADCFITKHMFENLKPQFEPCKCSVEDFECDFNFALSEDGKDCTPAAGLQAPEGQCKTEDDTFKGPSGWRLIPGNACQRDGGEHLDKEIERPCKNASTVPSGNAKNITSTLFSFEAKDFDDYYYLERAGTSDGKDETIVMLTTDGVVWVTLDHGKTWKHILKGIQEIIPHSFINDCAYFLTDTKEHFVTVNRATTIDMFEGPAERNGNKGATLSFHPKNKDWVIWTGNSCSHSSVCTTNSYLTKRRGNSWDLLLRTVEKCNFMAREDRKDSEELIFCDQHENEDPEGQRTLVTSWDLFAKSKTPLKEGILNFATSAEFIVIAADDPENPESFKAETSIDGEVFADAKFPPNIDIPKQLAYTVLESWSHSVLLHVTVNDKHDQSYGSLVKSNSNGTSYVLTRSGVNRNSWGYVDFEKLQGLEGVMLVNVVDNIEEVEKGSTKKLKTMITHNDGAQWAWLTPPAKDSDGKSYSCGSGGEPTNKCALHLHGYTEKDPRATYASASAVGFAFGVGNVGESLSENKDDASTFFSRDGGISWKEIRKGRHLWEYGDQGSVLVLVEELQPTRVVYFSMDEGENWEQYEFSDNEIIVEHLSTVPSDNSKNFLLWGKQSGSNQPVTVNLDFSGLRDRSCHLDEDSGDEGDFYLWEPKHPFQEDNCLFGHVEQYHRKKAASHCWNSWADPHVHSIARNCSCTREDFEW